MWAVILSLILGLIIGYYARDVHNKLSGLFEYWKDKMESPPGVVRPTGIPVTRNQPIDLTSDTGPVMRATPAELEEQRQAARAKILQDNHR